jgi:hypothetical protein
MSPVASPLDLDDTAHASPTNQPDDRISTSDLGPDVE